MADVTRRIRWVLDVAGDQQLEELLAADRRLQASLRRTDQEWSRTARQARTASSEMQRGLSQVSTNATRASRATTQVGTAQARAARDSNLFVRSQREVATSVTGASRRADQATRSWQRLRQEQRRAVTAGEAVARTSKGIGRGGVLLNTIAGTAGAAGVFGVGALAKEAADYQQQMSKVQAVAGATNRELRLMDKLAQDLGQKTAFSASDSAAAMLELAKAGFTARQTMKTLPGTMDLAAASGTELAEAATIQSDAIRGFSLQAKDAGRVADVFALAVNKSAIDMSDLGYTLKYMAPIAHTTGQSFEDMTAAVAILGNVGIRADTAGTTLRTLMTRLVKPTHGATEALDELGLTVKDLQGPDGLLPLPQIIEKIVAGAQKLPKADQLRVLTTVFGREPISGISTLVDRGAPAIRKLSDELQHADGAADRMARTMQNNVKASVEQVTGALETGAIRIFQAFQDDIRDGALTAADAIQDFTSNRDNIDRIVDTIKDAGEVTGDLVETITPLVKTAGDAVGAFADLPDPIKHAAFEMGLLYAVTRKLAGSAAVSALTGKISGLRRELQLVPAAVTAASSGMTPLTSAGSTTTPTFFVDSKGNVSTSLKQPGRGRQLLTRMRPGRRNAIAGIVAGGGSGVFLGDDPLSAAVAGAATGGAFGGPWGALIGGVSGAFGSAIYGWIQSNGEKAGRELGKRLAPGLSAELQRPIGEKAKQIQDVQERISELNRQIEASRKSVEAGGTLASHLFNASARTEQAAAEKPGALKELEKRQRELGRLVAQGVAQTVSETGDGRNLRLEPIVRKSIQQLRELDPVARQAGARTILEWARGMEDRGRLAEGTTDKLAKRITAPFKGLAKSLRDNGIAATDALNKGLQMPGAVDNARKVVNRISGLYDDLPKHLKITRDNAAIVLEDLSRQLQNRLPNATGKGKRKIEQDLAKVEAAIDRLTRSSPKVVTFADLLNRQLGNVGRNAGATAGQIKLIGDNIRGLPADGLPWENPFGAIQTPGGKKSRNGGKGRRGGIVGRFQAGGMVPIAVSPGEQIVYGDTAWTVPGAPTAADSVTMMAPMGAAVLTWDGQAKMAMGASLGEAIATQLPHFRDGGWLTPGQMATLAYSVGHVRPKSSAIRMGAIGMRESRGNPAVHNYDPPRDDSWGLWQINVLPNANPKYKSWNLTDPRVNARAMGQLYRAAGFTPWGGYSESSYSGWLDDAARGFGRSFTAQTGARASKTRSGLLDDALEQGIQLGEAGYTRGLLKRYGNPILDQLRQAQQPTTTRVSGVRSSSTSSRRRGSYPMVTGDTDFLPRLGNALSRMARATRTPIYVTDGRRTLAEQAALVRQKGAWSPSNPGAAPATPNAPHVRGVAGDIRPGRERFGSVAGRYGLAFPVSNEPWHVQLLRTGGVIGRRVGSRAGGYGAFSPAVNAAVSMKGGSLAELDEVIGQAAQAKLDELRKQVLASVRSGGSRQTVQRLQQVLDLIDAEIGRRIGFITYQVQQRSSRTGAVVDAMDRARRRQAIGMTDDQRAVLEARGQTVDADLQAKAARDNLRALNRQLKLADSHGASKERLDSIREAIQQEYGNLDEARTSRAEGRAAQMEAIFGAFRNARQSVVDVAQQQADLAQGGIDLGQASSDKLDATQRLAGTSDTAGGMVDRAQLIQSAILPALQSYGSSLQEQLARQTEVYNQAIAQGDTDGANEIFQAMQQTATGIEQNGAQITGAMADAGDLMRQAALKSAADLVDVAEHGATMADLGLQRLELEQRLAGTYDQGGAQRAEYIRNTILPAVQSEIAALQNQQAVAMAQGDPVLARQIAEAIAGKQNELLQDQVDALEQIEQNTKPRQFGGSLAFQFGSGETLTDQLVAAGRGI